MSDLRMRSRSKLDRSIQYNDLSPTDYEAALLGFGLPKMIVDVVLDADMKSLKGELDSSSRDLSKLLGRKHDLTCRRRQNGAGRLIEPWRAFRFHALCRLALFEGEEHDELYQALFLTAGGESLGFKKTRDSLKARPQQFGEIVGLRAYRQLQFL